MVDLSDFIDEILDPYGFGVEATWTPSGGQGKAIHVVFENSFIALEGVGDVGVASSMPTVLCRSSDVEGAARGDAVEVNGTTYNVVESRPDGDGFTLLVLSKD